MGQWATTASRAPRSRAAPANFATLSSLFGHGGVVVDRSGSGAGHHAAEMREHRCHLQLPRIRYTTLLDDVPHTAPHAVGARRHGRVEQRDGVHQHPHQAGHRVLEQLLFGDDQLVLAEGRQHRGVEGRRGARLGEEPEHRSTVDGVDRCGQVGRGSQHDPDGARRVCLDAFEEPDAVEPWHLVVGYDHGERLSAGEACQAVVRPVGDIHDHRAQMGRGVGGAAGPRQEPLVRA